MLYTDEYGARCDIPLNVVGDIDIYVLHSFTPGVISSRYRIQNCGTGYAWVADDNYSNVAVGTSVTGVEMDYVHCRIGPYLVQRVTFFGTAPPPGGSGFKPMPYANDPHVQVVTCDDEVVVVDRGGVCAGGELYCDCVAPYHNCPLCWPTSEMCDLPVPVESTTWGRIKVLYQ